MALRAPEKTARQAMLVGSFWTVSMRWGLKTLGFVSTAILARLIAPSEYAVVAMAYLVFGLMDAFFSFGVETALIRKDGVDRDFINSAWSLQIVEGLGIGLLMVVLSPLATLYFHDQRVAPVLWILACCIGIAGSNNIGVVLARKNLDFSLEFKIKLIGKFLQVFVTICTAFFLRDYRALVAGIVVSYMITWCLTYALSTYRPRWNTTGFVEIWLVTRWLMLSNVARFIVRKADEISAGRIGTATQFGMYNVGADIGQLPTNEVGPAILRAFFPVLSSLQKEPERVRSAVLKVMAMVNAITIPAGVGLTAIAGPATLLILGPNWTGAIPYVAVFGLIGSVQVAAEPLSTLMTMRGFTKIQSHIVWVEFAVFGAASLIFVPAMHLQGLAIARLCGAVVSTFLIIYGCSKNCDLPIRESANTLWRPLLASTAMYFIAAWMLTRFTNPFAGMAAAVAIASFSYASLMLISWRLTGRPPGLEVEAMRLLGRLWKGR